MKDSYIQNNQRLQTERQDDGDRKLLRDLHLKIDGVDYIIPAGFKTDFSSIPRLGRWLVKWSKVDIAGVVHDWLYRDKYRNYGFDSVFYLLPFVGDDNEGHIARREADWVWYLVALSGEHGANPLQAALGWMGLRLGGWFFWNRVRKQQNKRR